MTKKVVTILKDMDCLMSTTELINQSGFSHEIKITDCRTIESNYYLSQQLNVPLATKLFYLCRERIVDGIPSVIEKNYVPYSFVPGIEKLDFSGSYYARLKEKYNIMISVSEEELLIVNAKDDEIAMLNIPNGSEILLDKGLSYVSEKRDKPFEYFEIVSLPSFFQFRSVSKNYE